MYGNTQSQIKAAQCGWYNFGCGEKCDRWGNEKRMRNEKQRKKRGKAESENVSFS